MCQYFILHGGDWGSIPRQRAFHIHFVRFLLLHLVADVLSTPIGEGTKIWREITNSLKTTSATMGDNSDKGQPDTKGKKT